jgi:hypothetical protein
MIHTACTHSDGENKDETARLMHVVFLPGTIRLALMTHTL